MAKRMEVEGGASEGRRVIRKDTSYGSRFIWFVALFAGALFAISSRNPETWFGTVSCLIVAALLSWSAREEAGRERGRPLLMLFCSGIIFHLIAFSWIADTISFFGGFPWLGASALSLLFSVISSLQFVVVGLVFKLLGGGPKRDGEPARFGVELFALAWFVGEFFVPRLFPWSIVHGTVRLTYFAMLSSIVGVAPLSALLLWWGGSISDFISASARKATPRWLSVVRLSSLSLLLIGGYRSSVVSAELTTAPTVQLGIIQGNLDAKRKGDIKYFDVNMERYRSLTAEAIKKGAAAILWPESVMNIWVGEDVSSVLGTNIDPLPFETRIPMVYGGLSYRKPSPEEVRAHAGDPQGANFRKDTFHAEKLYSKYNAAFSIDRSGDITGRYYKRVLMPFGEYLPFEKTFPWLRDISPYTGDFAIGDKIQPLPLLVSAVGGSEVKMNIAALVCYEDLIPSMSREGVSLGANILVNLTNDAWYGDTPAPHQHQLLALWRAIESGRYLVRVTNTGLTAVVNPFGVTELRMKTFVSSSAVQPVKLLQAVTPYVIWGDIFSWLLATVAGVSFLFKISKAR